MSTRAYLAVGYLWVVQGKAKKKVFEHLIVESNWFVGPTVRTKLFLEP